MQALESNPAAADTTEFTRAARRRSPTARIGLLLPGLLLCALLAAAATYLGQVAWLAAYGLSPLTLAIILGMAFGNTVFPRVAAHCGAGVGFSKQHLLRLGIILYGFRLSFQDIGQVGLAGVAIDVLVLGSTFGLALLLGSRLFKLDRDTTILIGAGSAICGAAAVLATEPVLRARTEKVTVAVSTVVVFGTLAIFLYPLLYRLNLEWQVLGSSSFVFGIYIGSTVHEVAQVVAAAQALSPAAADTAVITKMVRVMLLAPFLIGLSLYLAQRQKAVASNVSVVPARIALPWFALAFIAVCGFNSLSLLPPSLVAQLINLDTVLLTMAMAALGLSTHLSAIRRAGIKPLLLAGLLFIWLIGGGALINRTVLAWAG